MIRTVNLVNVPVFFSWKTAQGRNFFSKTEWRRRDFDVSAFDPDGLVVLETQKVRIPSAWQPALSIDGEFFIVASVWFDVFSSDLVSGVSSSSDFPSETVSVSLPSMKNHRLSRTLADCQSSSVFDSESERDLKSENLSDSNSSSISSIKKKEERGGEEGKKIHHDRKTITEIAQTSSKQKTSEVNNFAEPRKRQNQNHPCWIPNEYPLEQVPDELKDALLKFSNLVFLKVSGQPNPDEYVPLMRKLLDETFGRQVSSQTLKIAFETGLLESDNHYEIGQKSKGYRFADKFRNQPFRIINTFRTKKEQFYSDKLMNHRDHKHIRYLWEHLNRITVNNRLVNFRHDWTIYEPCQSIINGHFYLSQDDFGGRWYSNLTNLKREARGLLRIEGKSESLWEIDIKNSQPLFASIAAQSKGFHDEGFSSLCQQGVLYESLMSLWGMTRDEAKQELLKIFYSKNGYRSETKSKFASQFPTFSDFVFKSKKLNHKHFANLMQTTERKFIVDTVVPELIRQSPGIFIATIHDSLLVENRRAEFAHDVLSGLFMGQFGVKPMTHMKDTGDYLR